MDIKSIISRAGGPTAVGALFGISRQAVIQWTKVPAERCMALAEATKDLGITVHDLRPDIYGAPPPSRAQPAKRDKAA